MKSIRVLSQCLMLAGTLAAADIASASVTGSITYNNSAQQLGREVRNGVPQNWVGGEGPFPGINNVGVPLRYVEYSVQVGSQPFLEIDFDSLSLYTFASAYQTSYLPNSDSTVNAGFQRNWLGDAGTSENYFGSDILSFFVVGAPNSTVLIVINTTAFGLGIGDPFTLSAYSYSDTEYSDQVELALTPVVLPEPSTALLLLAPLVALGARRLRRRAKQARSLDALAA